MYYGFPLLETAQQRKDFFDHLNVMVARHRGYVLGRRHYILTRPSPYGPIRKRRHRDADQAARQLKQAQSALFQVMEVRNIFMQLNLKGQSPHWEWASVNAAYNKNMREIKRLTTVVAQAGALSWDGSFIARKVVAMDDTKVSFEGGQKKEWLSTVNTAAVLFGPMSLSQANKLKAKRPGVLLASGDFIEGTFKSLANGTVVVDSVLFGRKSYPVGTEAVALWLRNPQPRTPNVLTQAWAKSDNGKLGDLEKLQDEQLKIESRLGQLSQFYSNIFRLSEMHRMQGQALFFLESSRSSLGRRIGPNWRSGR
jgi:hypothetical protein